jgi:hypothetical protein
MSAASKVLPVVAAVALVGIAAFAYNGARATAGGPSAGPVQTADGTPINACALLSDAEVTAAVGAPVNKGERRDEGDVGGKGNYAPAGTYSSTCIWQFQLDAHFESDPTLPMGGKRFAILNAMVWPKNEDAASFLQSFRDAFKHDIIPSDPVVVTGMGDEALWWGDGTAVRKGKISIGMSVFLQNGDKESQRVMEEQLARKILPRL